MPGVGDRVEAGGIAVMLAQAGMTDRISQFLDPDPGNEYLVIEVVIENTSRDEAPYNPLYFSVKDGEGFEYDATFIGPDQALKSGTLAKGDKVRGRVAFAVPKTADKFIVRYEPLVILGGYKSIRFGLQRTGQ